MKDQNPKSSNKKKQKPCSSLTFEPAVHFSNSSIPFSSCLLPSTSSASSKKANLGSFVSKKSYTSVRKSDPHKRRPLKSRKKDPNVHHVSDFLPMSPEDMALKGWDELDIILVSGDAYVDHSGFGTAVIGRVLEDAGYRVGIISQPDWKSPKAFQVLGKPRLFFSVSAGNADSLVNNYTPLLYPRDSDAYSPGGKPGLRPDRAVITYGNMLRRLFPKTPIIAGGIEASLRRFSEFDYLSNKVRKSILADAPIDMIVYGMGELQIKEIASRISKGEPVEHIRNIPGTVWKMTKKEWTDISYDKKRLFDGDFIELPSFSDVFSDKRKYAEAFRIIYENQNHVIGKPLVQQHPKMTIVQNPPMRPLTVSEMDHVYSLAYTREAHPSYEEAVPALDIVRLSITTHRGCFGSCSFCAIAQHQGRIISNRSEKSILEEAEKITKLPGFNGIINGVGGPSANMYGMSCAQWSRRGACTRKNCLVPSRCPSLKTDYAPLLSLLDKLRNIPNVRKVITGYGVRFDLATFSDEYMETLCRYHVGGQLKVAPEHFCDNVTAVMNKPGRASFEEFDSKFKSINKKLGLEQYLITFQISGHPGCTLSDAVEMAEYIRDNNRHTEQVQDFTPTPMTISTCMFHTGLDPFTAQPVYVPATRTEKKMQRALLQYRLPQNRDMVKEALIKAKRKDLIGSDKTCLIR